MTMRVSIGPALDVAPRWRFARLLDAPHRLAFAAGTLMLVLASLWWAAMQLAANAGTAWRSSLPPAAAHGLLMTFGYMPMYFSGFLFTAGPRWLAQRPLAARELLPSLLAQLAGWAVFMLALHGRDAAFGQSVGAIGLGAVAIGWAGSVRRFAALVASSTVPDRRHAKLVTVGAACGVVALCLAAGGLLSGRYEIVSAATRLGLWACIGLVFVTVAHRMIPFFSVAVPRLDAWHPDWLLWGLVALVGIEALVDVAAILPGGTASAAAHAARATLEAGAGVGLLALAVRWAWVRGLPTRMVTMLHVGLSWLGVAMLWSGLAHAVAAAGGPPAVLGLAPTHAYTMGFLGSTMFAMVTRVSSGHGGRALAADDFVWRLFWVLQLAVLARLAAALLMHASAPWGTALLAAAAVGWTGVVVVWGLRHAHWYGRPRADGRAG